jgi:hypothetical protein
VDSASPPCSGRTSSARGAAVSTQRAGDLNTKSQISSLSKELVLTLYKQINIKKLCFNQRGKCILFSVDFTPPTPQATTAVFGSYMSSLPYS